MKKYILILLLIGLTFVSCTEYNEPFKYKLLKTVEKYQYQNNEKISESIFEKTIIYSDTIPKNTIKYGDPFVICTNSNGRYIWIVITTYTIIK